MNSTSPPKRSTRLIVWFVAIALIVGFGWYKDRENQHRREIAFQPISDSKLKHTEINDFLSAQKDKPNSRLKIEQRFNNGQHFEGKREGNLEVVEWDPTEFNNEFQLKFKENELVDFAVYPLTRMQSGRLIFMHLESIHFNSPAQSTRSFFAGPWVISFWVLAIILGLTRVGFNRIAAEAAVLLSLLIGMCWLLNPKYSVTVSGMLANDALAYALMIFGFSV